MNKNSGDMREEIQRMIVKMIATNPEGRNLHLIGGYRFRLLDNSPRMSKDIDYHSLEDLVLSTILCKFDIAANWDAPFLRHLPSNPAPSLAI